MPQRSSARPKTPRPRKRPLRHRGLPIGRRDGGTSASVAVRVGWGIVGFVLAVAGLTLAATDTTSIWVAFVIALVGAFAFGGAVAGWRGVGAVISEATRNRP